MGAYSSDTFTFRHALMFTSRSVADLYPDYDPEKALDQFKDDPERDAGWKFRDVRTRQDVKTVRALQIVPGVDMDALLRKLEKAEDEIVLNALHAQIEEGTRTNAAFAELECFTDEVFGPYFRLPTTYRMVDFHRNKTAKDAQKLHPLAGTIPQPDPEWLERIDEVIWQAALVALRTIHEGRTPDGEATFRA